MATVNTPALVGGEWQVAPAVMQEQVLLATVERAGVGFADEQTKFAGQVGVGEFVAESMPI